MIRLPHAYPTEIAQLAFAVAALLYLGWAVWETYRIDRSRRRLGLNGELARISVGNLLRACFRCLKALTFLTIGIVSVTVPPPYTIFEPIDAIINADLELGISVVRWLVMFATVLLLLDSMTERWFSSARERYRSNDVPRS